MLPGDRLVCAFVGPQAVGTKFEIWLPHVTIVPWFRLADDPITVARGLRQALTAIGAFEAAFEGQAMFGPRKDRPALLIRRPTGFDELEPKVRAYLHKKRAWLVDETTKRRHDFRPHVTVQAGATLSPDETFRCDKLYIVEQKGEYKEIVNEVIFGA